MAIQRTRWEPDTHPGTIIDYEWDDSLPEAERVHTPVNVMLPDGSKPSNAQIKSHFDRVLSHNQRKNMGIAEIIAANPAWADRVTWELNSDTGVVTYYVTGLTAAQRTTVANKLAAKFGANAVLG